MELTTISNGACQTKFNVPAFNGPIKDLTNTYICTSNCIPHFMKRDLVVLVFVKLLLSWPTVFWQSFIIKKKNKLCNRHPRCNEDRWWNRLSTRDMVIKLSRKTRKFYQVWSFTIGEQYGVCYKEILLWVVSLNNYAN